MSEKPADLICIAGVLVRCQPKAQPAVSAALSKLSGVEVHGANEQGAIVTTIEANGARDIADCISAISLMPLVLAATPVYSHLEPEQ